MKVETNIIDTRCIIMSEADTVSNLMNMTWIASEESLATYTHIHTDTYNTQTRGHLFVKRFQNKKEKTPAKVGGVKGTLPAKRW